MHQLQGGGHYCKPLQLRRLMRWWMSLQTSVSLKIAECACLAVKVRWVKNLLGQMRIDTCYTQICVNLCRFPSFELTHTLDKWSVMVSMLESSFGFVLVTNLLDQPHPRSLLLYQRLRSLVGFVNDLVQGDHICGILIRANSSSNSTATKLIFYNDSTLGS